MERQRARGPREAVTAHIGQVGRITGRAMPALGEIPLTQDGFEDPELFFRSPEPQPQPPSQPQPGRTNHPLNPPSSAARRQRRPDVTADVGYKGRKTGKVIAPPSNARKNKYEMDDPDLYFKLGPDSIPPLQKKRVQQQAPRISAAYTDGAHDTSDEQESQSENEPFQADDTAAQDEQEEESDGEENQTANYGSRVKGAASRVSKASTRRAASASASDDEAESDDAGEAETTLGTRPGRRVSQATSRADTTYSNNNDDDVFGAVDDGTQTMEIEGSSYYNKSSRTAYGALAGNGSAKKAAAVTSSEKSAAARRPASDSESGSEDEQEVSTPRRSTAVASMSRVPGARTGAAASSSTVARAAASRNDDGSSSEDENIGSTSLAKGKQPQVAQDDYSDDDGDGGAGPVYYDDGDIDNGGSGYDDFEDDEEEEVGRLEPVQEEDEDEAEDEDELPPPLASAGKSRKRARDDSGHVSEHDEEEEEERAAQSKSKAKGKGRAVPASNASTSTAAGRRKRQKTSYDPEGVRRSGRDRTSPVDFWRNEHVIYRRRDSAGGAVYYDKMGVHTRPKQPVRHLGVAARSASQRAKSRSVPPPASRSKDKGKGKQKEKEEEEHNWAEWDEETDPDGIVWDYTEGREHKDRIAFTRAMMDPKPTKNHAYKFQRIFTDGDYLAAGVLVIPPNESKPLKPARDNTYIIFCVTGAVRVLVHRTEFSMGPGSMFKIPRGNSYQIHNMTDIEAFMVFFQAREIAAVVDNDDEGDK